MNSIQAQNREQLIAYFADGCKDTQTLGFELEHIILHRADGAPVSYSEPGGIHDILERLAPSYRDVLYENEQIVGLVRCRETITIEPAGQLEISLGPFTSTSQIGEAYAAFREILDPILDDFGLYTPLIGYNPAACARDLELVPKQRYERMTEFLGAQSYSAICMMRGTASLQISVDYASEHDALQKLRVAQKLTPVLALMCDNVAIFEQEPWTGHLARTQVWAGMWQDRVGTIPGSLDPAFDFADYADYIMTREAILVPDAHAPEGWRYVASQTFDEIYADRVMDKHELEHALSMVWPDARLKYFIEIRPADALPLEHSLAYTSLVRALFYSPEALERLDTLLADVGEEDVHEAKRTLMEGGYDAPCYGKTAAYWADLVVELAREFANEDDAHYLDALTDLVAARQTLKDA